KLRRPAVRTGQLLKAVLVIELGAVTEKSSESTKLVPDFEIEIENAPKSGGRFATKSSATEALAPHPNAVASKRFLSVFTILFPPASMQRTQRGMTRAHVDTARTRFEGSLFRPPPPKRSDRSLRPYCCCAWRRASARLDGDCHRRVLYL